MAHGTPASGTGPAVAPTARLASRMETQYNAALRKLLAYIAGALAGFLPLVEYAINARNAPTGPVWYGFALGHAFWEAFVVLGSLVTIGFSWAALGSVYLVTQLERELGTEGYGLFPLGRPRIPQVGWRLWTQMQPRGSASRTYSLFSFVIDLLCAGVLVFVVVLAIVILSIPPN
jgi:hypothetical protein